MTGNLGRMTRMLLTVPSFRFDDTGLGSSHGIDMIVGRPILLDSIFRHLFVLGHEAMIDVPVDGLFRD